MSIIEYNSLYINNMKILVLIFSIFISFNLSADKSKKIPVLDFSRWQEMTKKISSPNSSDRISAIKMAQDYPEIRTENLIKERLVIENHEEVLEIIFEYLEKRKSKKDFFYVLDFLKRTSKKKYASRAILLLYAIHPPRTRFEIGQLLKEDRSKILSIIYISSINSPSKSDLKWFSKVFLKYKLATFWATLPPVKDDLLLKNLNSYLESSDVRTANDISSFFWYLKSSHYSSTRPKVKILNEINPDNIAKLSFERQINFLYLLTKYNPGILDGINFTDKASSPMKKWMIKRYLLNRKRKWKNTFNFLLLNENRQGLLWAIAIYADKLSEKEKDIWLNRCNEKTVKAWLCLRSYIVLKRADKAWQLWLNANHSRRTSMTLKNLSGMMKLDKFHKNLFFISWILNHESLRLRLKGAMVFPDEIYRKQSPLIISHWLSENTSTLRQIFLARVFPHKDLMTVYSKYIPSVAFSNPNYFDSDLKEIFEEEEEDESESTEIETSREENNTEEKKKEEKTKEVKKTEVKSEEDKIKSENNKNETGENSPGRKEK